MIKKYFHKHIKRNFSIAMVWIDGGSSSDRRGKRGINNILCSMLTRGSKDFADLKLFDFIESYGAELNNEVFEDGILISIKSLDIHFNKLFPLMNSIINEPILSESQFYKVKKLIIDSIKKEKENPFNTAFEKWRKIVYSDHPYGFNAMGYEKDVLSIKHNDLLTEYENFKSREKYLISNNSKVKQYLIKNNQKTLQEKTRFINHKLNNELRIVSSFNKSNQLIIMLGNQTCSRRSKEYLPLKILESYLSFGMSSILFKLFREKNGMTYDVGVFHPSRKENAPFLIYLSVANNNALKAFELLITLWRQLLFNLISDKEFFLAKEKLKSSFLIRNQSLEEILRKELQLISLNIKSTPESIMHSEIDRITSKDIKKITQKFFRTPFLSISGDKEICDAIKTFWLEYSFF